MTFSIYLLKPKFQKLLAPVLKYLEKLRISPNQITLFTMLISLAYGAALVHFSSVTWLWTVFPAFMLLRMALNAIDGMLANATQQKTKLGSLLNEVCDQISDVALYLPFALLPNVSSTLVVLVVVVMLLAEFAGVAALVVGAPRRFDGPMGKSDRAFAFSVVSLISVTQIAYVWINGLLLIVLLLLFWTMINRLVKALRHSANTEPLKP